MDGVPAPISMLVDPSTNPEAIALVTETLMYDMLIGEEDASPNWDPEMNWYGPMGIGYAHWTVPVHLWIPVRAGILFTNQHVVHQGLSHQSNGLRIGGSINEH